MGISGLIPFPVAWCVHGSLSMAYGCMIQMLGLIPLRIRQSLTRHQPSVRSLLQARKFGVLIAMTMAITMAHSRTKNSLSSTRDSIVRSSNLPWLSIRASLLFEVSIAASERMWRSMFQLILAVQFRGHVDFMVTRDLADPPSQLAACARSPLLFVFLEE